MKTPGVIPKASGASGSLRDDGIKIAFLGAALLFALFTQRVGLAEESRADEGGWVPTPLNPGLQLPHHRDYPYFLAQNVQNPGSVAPTPGSLKPTAPKAAPGAQPGKPVRAERKPDKSYLVPAGEVVGFNVLLNRFNYYFIDKEVYGVTYSSVHTNLTSKWVVDTDPFATNQFMHPYQGSVYFGLSRSAGNDFWESLAYSFGGSLIWEIAGETGLPSINDLVTTSFGGAFLGEPLFRMASLLLEGGGETPGFWRELGAAVISPPLGFNRLAFGDRFRTVFDSRDPAVFSYVRLGGSRVERVIGTTASDNVKSDTAVADFHLTYGLPGRNGYKYTRPFDYFDFEFTATTANVFEDIMSRGLLVGKEYTLGGDYAGVWGLYGTYDYIAPQVFRVSSTALSFGTTAQWWVSDSVALQGTALAGLGYGAAGTIHSTGERDYHYGATPQALLALRLIFGESANLDLMTRSYYVSDVASTENRGSERIFRGDVVFTVHVQGPHAVALKYAYSQRDAHYADTPSQHQSVATASLFYTYIFGGAKGVNNFGAVMRHSTDQVPIAP
jgi:hypothetical protein